MNHFINTLRSGKVLLMDGAMGTELLRLQSGPFDCCERANLTDIPLVCDIHHAYLDAGAEVLLTNTFQANPLALARHCLADRFHEIWQSAIEMARAPIGKPHHVLADIGPIERLTLDVAKDLLAESRHADSVLLETWTSHDDLAMFAAARSDTTPPMLVSFTFQRDTHRRLMTFANQTPEECARAAVRNGAIVLGTNCGKVIGTPEMIEIVRRYHDACDLPIFVRMNAGTPTASVYPRSPEQMADELPRLLEEGIAMIGGCCGTTPDHIWRMRLVLDTWRNTNEPEA